eukprot:352901-Chlamydomonas_euryale.AAC.5
MLQLVFVWKLHVNVCKSLDHTLQAGQKCSSLRPTLSQPYSYTALSNVHACTSCMLHEAGLSEFYSVSLLCMRHLRTSFPFSVPSSDLCYLSCLHLVVVEGRYGRDDVTTLYDVLEGCPQALARCGTSAWRVRQS